LSLLFQNFGRAQGATRRLLSGLFSVCALLPGLALAQAPPKPILTPAQDSTPAPAATAAPSATAPDQPVATPIDPNSYIIGAQDALQVTVWKEPTLSGSFLVRPDGMISLVLVGDIRAAGFTPTQLGKDISTRLEKFVQNPIVTVVVSAVNSQHIYMVGEVGHVGPIQLIPGMTPLQAISTAGGLSPYANKTHIYILRGPQGKQVKIPFDYKKALKGDNQQNVSLLPGDTIVVP
jgi:polysaccharide biosynthesis/export protein